MADGNKKIRLILDICQRTSRQVRGIKGETPRSQLERQTGPRGQLFLAGSSRLCKSFYCRCDKQPVTVKFEYQNPIAVLVPYPQPQLPVSGRGRLACHVSEPWHYRLSGLRRTYNIALRRREFEPKLNRAVFHHLLGDRPWFTIFAIGNVRWHGAIFHGDLPCSYRAPCSRRP